LDNYKIEIKLEFEKMKKDNLLVTSELEDIHGQIDDLAGKTKELVKDMREK
jgi:hypothetical protein